MTATRIEDEDLELLKEAALLYLDQTSQLALVKQKCENYINNKEVSITVRANYRIWYSFTRFGNIFFCFTFYNLWRLK